MKSDVTLKIVTLDSCRPAAQIKHSLAQATGKDSEWEAALDDPQWFFQPQDSAPMCHNQMLLQKNQSFKSIYFFFMLICIAILICSEFQLIMFWVQHGYFISQEFALTHVLSGAFLGALFLYIQWPPSHRACAKTC